MEVNDFKKLLEETELSIDKGGCALVFATDSEGEATAFIKGKDKEILIMLIGAMSKSDSIRDIVLAAVHGFRLVRESY